MNLLELTNAIQQHGLAIVATIDGKVAAGPKSKLTPVIRQAIAEHKDSLRKLFPPPALPTDRREQIRTMLDRVARGWPEGYELEPDAEPWDASAKAIDEALASSDDQRFSQALEAYEATAEGLYERFAIQNEAGDTSFDAETFERLERRATQIKNECKRRGQPTIDDVVFRMVGLLDRWRTKDNNVV